MPIFFDIDDTLLDGGPATRKACSVIQAEFGKHLDVTKDEFLRDWTDAIEIFYGLYLHGKISFKEMRRKRLAYAFKMDENALAPDVADEMYRVYSEIYQDHWCLFSDVIPCLENLKGYDLGIITNGDSGQQSLKLEKIGIGNYFKSVIISGRIGYSKPDRRIFEYACNSLSASPGNCVFIGDRLDTDAMAGEAIGMTGIWINRNNEPKSGHVKVIHSLHELPGILERYSL